jgi:hypothetical protein
MVHGGRITPGANAWSTTVTWGSAATPDQQNIEWGVACGAEACDSPDAWTPWGSGTGGISENVVWGVLCGGDNCAGPWTVDTAGAVATSDGSEDTIVWGTNDDADTIVWGTADEDTIVWGTSCSDVCEPVIWNQQ